MRLHPNSPRFRQLLDLASFYLDFPIDDHTGEPLKEDDVLGRHYEKVGAAPRGLGAAKGDMECVCVCM
jgi:hypothetical protein